MSIKRRLSVRSPFAQWLMLAAVLLVVGSVIGASLYSEREAIETGERLRLQSYGKIVVDNLSHQLRSTSNLLNSIRSDLPFLSAPREGDALVSRRLKAMSEVIPGVRTLVIIDATGTVSASNREELIGRNFREREYFRVPQQERNPATLYVSPPFKTVLGAFSVNLSTVLIDALGAFSGIISATLDPDYFRALLNSIRYAPDVRASLIDRDGTIFLTLPQRPGVDGTNIAQPGSFFTRHQDSGQQSSLFTGTVYATGDARIMHQRTLEIEGLTFDRPFVFAVSRDLPVIFSDWRVDAYAQAGGFCLLVLMASAGLYMYQRRQRTYDDLLFTREAERKQAEVQVENLAFHDQLTGLPNRRLLLDRLKHALAVCARTRQFGAVLFIDLDNFKTINDTQGHEVGDTLLQEVATRLSACVRASDTVARLGGDEFVVMLESLGSKFSDARNEAQALGNKVLKAIREPFQIGSLSYVSTTSIGIACFSDDRLDTVDEILRHADLAMYQAKADGRNTQRVFDSGMQTRVSKRAILEAELRTALNENQFRLFYQPQVIESGQVYAAEALLRWQHPQRGLVQPSEFISIAEETGLILPLGLWVLNCACAQLAHWATLPLMKNLILSINVSARQFHSPDFVDQVHSSVDRNGANQNLLKLELTESLLLTDVEGTIAKFKALRSYGLRFSLDDFGTGYSSLSYLRRLPLDQLKIDQSFVRDLPEDANASSVVCTILALGNSLGLRVIAEGVETQEQRNFLADNGCCFFQGYLFGHPTPSDEFTAFVTANAEHSAEAVGVT